MLDKASPSGSSRRKGMPESATGLRSHDLLSLKRSEKGGERTAVGILEHMT